MSALMGLEQPLSRDRLLAHLHELIERNGHPEVGLQLFLTGGLAADGFTPSEPFLAVYATAVPKQRAELYRDGAKLVTHRYRREFPRAKTTDYQMAVRQVPRMREAGAIDVLYHHGGRALETARSNLFVVGADGAIATPGEDILEGVTRTNVLRALADHRELVEREIPLAELWSASELFITSTTKGAMPITAIDDRIIGSGEPGPVMAEVAELFRRWVDRYLVDAAGRRGGRTLGSV
jgi:D-alanine transaminase/branched-chain amino acid aminotransferase